MEKYRLAGISTELLKSRETARRIAKLRKRWEEWWEKGIVFLGWSGITVQRWGGDIRFATPRVQNISEEARESQLLGLSQPILTEELYPSFFQRSSCRQSISCFSNNTARIALKNSTGSDDRWSPFLRDSKRWVDSFRKKRKKEEKREKKEWPRFDIKFFFFFFFHREETFQFKFNFGPDPLKIPRFWDTNLCSPPRSMKQKKRKKEASRTRSFLYSASYYEFCFSLLAGNVTSQPDEIHGLIQEMLLLETMHAIWYEFIVLKSVDKFVILLIFLKR